MLYKIESFSSTATGLLDVLHLTAAAKPAAGSVPSTVTVSQWAAAITFTGGASGNWADFARVGVVADPGFTLPPGRANLRMFPKQSHMLSGIRGPLAVEGGTTNADRSLKPAIMLPGEVNGPFFAVAQQPPESQQIDVLNVYADGSRQDLTGRLTSTALTGLYMGSDLDFRDLFGPIFVFPFGEPGFYPGGISYGSIRLDSGGNFVTDGNRTTVEVINVLLGAGNDHLEVVSTIVPGPDLGITVAGAVITANSITRVAGRTWTQDGYAVGQRVAIDELPGLWTITAISGNGLTLTLEGAPLNAGTRSVTVGVVALHGGLTTVHGGGNSLLQIAGTFDVTADRIVRRDGLSWTAAGFVAGQHITLTGPLAGTYAVLGFANSSYGVGTALLLGGPALTPQVAVASTVTVTDSLAVVGSISFAQFHGRNGIVRTDGQP